MYILLVLGRLLLLLFLSFRPSFLPPASNLFARLYYSCIASHRRRVFPMENGVEKKKPIQIDATATATADGGTAVSHFNFVHNAVQVFHPPAHAHAAAAADTTNTAQPKQEEEEEEAKLHQSLPGTTTTKTADGAISRFKLVDHVVQVFHQDNDNDNDDDVFEEAINENDNTPPQTIADSNGSLAHIEKFEEALDSDLPTSLDHNPFQPISSADNVELFHQDHNGNQLQLDDALLSNREVDDSALLSHGETNPSPDTKIESNGEEGDNQASASVAISETNPLADTKLESSREEGNAVVSDKSANGNLNKLEFEESETMAESSDFSRFASGDIVFTESGKVIRSEDTQCLSSNLEASVDGILENGKTEKGVLEKLELDEKPAVLANSDVSKVSSVENAPTEGDESVQAALFEGKDFSEKVISPEGEQNCEMRDTASSVSTFLKEDTSGMPDTKQNITDAVIKERAKTNADELEEKGSHYVQTQHNNEIIQEAQESVTQGSQDESRKQHSSSAGEPENQPAVEPVPTPPRHPAGLGAAAPLFEPASRALQQPRVNGAGPQRQAQLVEDPMNSEAEENDETREKLQMIRVKFLRLAHRLGQTPHNVVVAQVLYRLGLAEQLRGRNAGRVGAFSFDRASAIAEQLESAGQEPLDFSCTIMVLGKTGVGKSATINSIFDEMKFSTDAFQVGTKKVQDVVGTVQGIKVRVIDTPGLLPCWSDQRQNEKILHSVKQFIKKTPPDIVLYLDRLDMQSRDFGDLPLLRTITEIFGPSIWFNAIVVLTHAASAPPDGPNGISSSYEMFVTQRSHVVQQAIRQAAGDMRLMNPVSLVENHSACRTNRAGQRVLPNGQVWKPHLLLLSFASKILAEANTLLKLQDNPPGKPFATRPRVPPLPYLLSSLLQSRPQLKLPEEQFGDEDDLDDLDGSSDSDDESEYDELPPFKRLTKGQLAKLSRAQNKAYFEELAYRERLFMKRQLKEEKKRRKLLKKMGDSAMEVPNDYNENTEEESGGGASVPVALPDFSLPASFDSDNPSHRYRFLDTSNPWLVRPVLETHGWDHDVGYEGINVERLFVVKDKIPVSFSGQATKDKKESNLQMEVASTIKHNEGKATSVGFDMQTIGKDMSYTLRSETRFSNFRRNKTAAGVSVTLLGDALTGGMKVEDRLVVNNRFRIIMTGGAMTARGDIAYGGSLEATLRDKDYPLGRMLSTLGLSIMDWHGDLAIGCNVQSQLPIGRSSNVIGRANLNNKGSGQVSIRFNSAEQLQIALVGLLPLFRKGVALYQRAMHGE